MRRSIRKRKLLWNKQHSRGVLQNSCSSNHTLNSQFSICDGVYFNNPASCCITKNTSIALCSPVKTVKITRSYFKGLPEELLKIAVLHYFTNSDRKTYVMEYHFSKAAQAALLKMYSIADAYLLI